jgi:hypothetical protein
VVGLMSLTWPTILAIAVLFVVRERISRSKALRQAAADMPEMREAAKIHAESERETQRAMLGVKVWLYEKLPNGQVIKREVPALKAIGPPEIEHPAA